MALQVKRKSDTRVVKCILHRVADIPGGVTVISTNLGGSALFEGTPIGKASDGLYQVHKTAQIVTAADATAVSYEVAKGHHFQVGDYFATESCKGQAITAIDKSDAAKDVITVGTTLGAAIKAGATAFQSSGVNTTPKVEPIAIVGSNFDVVPGENIFVDAWVIAVVRESNAPAVTTAIKSALKNVAYV
jgi:hypothetical protein